MDNLKEIEYKIVLPGIGAFSNRGALGWCSISLIFAEDKTILFDTGSNDDREELLLGLKRIGVNIKDIDIVFISHLHYDHCCNIELFESADIIVTRRELEYVLSCEYERCSDPYVPQTVVKYFSERFKTVEDNDEITKGVRVILLPGHTPGSAGLLLENERIFIAGDAVKNAWDFTNNIPPRAIYDGQKGLQNYEKLRKKVDLIVPGHGRPFKSLNGKVEYVGDCNYTEIKLYPNYEHLNDLNERAYQRVIL